MSFFKIFNDHVDHLRKLFLKLIKLRIILNVKKTFFNYFNITLLKQKIDVFDLSITKKRIVVVKTIRFFKNLKTFEIYLDLTNYQKNKMTWYAQKTKFLQQKKTRLLRDSSFINEQKRKIYFRITLVTNFSILRESFN